MNYFDVIAILVFWVCLYWTASYWYMADHVTYKMTFTYLFIISMY